MKNAFFVAAGLMCIAACSKTDGGNPPGKEDSIKIVHDIVIGEWDYYRLEEKIFDVCYPQPCTLLNPDGSIRDTVRKSYTLTNSYWVFKTDKVSMFENRNNNAFGFENRPYEVIYDGKRIQTYGVEPHDIIKISSTELVLEDYSQGVGNGISYPEIFRRYYLRKK